MQLISDEYRSLNAELHKVNRFYGASSVRHVGDVTDLKNKYMPIDILDYGCGKSALARNVLYKIKQYDPAITKYKLTPSPADMVICTDVFEHIEPECIDGVLDHIKELTVKFGFFTVCTVPAKKVLSDGRNAHLLIRNKEWWIDKINDRFEIQEIKEKEAELIFIVMPKREVPKDAA